METQTYGKVNLYVIWKLFKSMEGGEGELVMS